MTRSCCACAALRVGPSALQLQEALERCAVAEVARDSLTAELARARSAAAGGAGPVPPASPGGAALRSEEALTELRLQRDQLQSQVSGS